MPNAVIDGIDTYYETHGTGVADSDVRARRF